MSNTTLAYYKVKSPASILNSRYRFFGSSRQPVSPFIRAASGLSLRAIALRLSITALILLLTGLAQAQRPAAATHIVKPGESLGKIADAYGVSLRELQAENNIWNWLIYAGQELAIPAGASPPEVQDFPTASNETSGITHTVLFGESLSTIASAYGVSLSELRT
ncbi:MAG: LysM peptidoglycan-binding domain-containing protein, partial [Chloroflexota bacterium]|nr:LysM peptidoglycan-binding domain-containing protein [Chloroflexota bacterium]